MAAPSGIVWGSIVGTSPHQARIGIYVKLTSTATQTTRHTEVWFWSKYSVKDTSNTFYYNDNATSATTSKGAVSINTTVSTGTGWSTTNQVKIAEYDYTFTKGTKADARSVAAKLTSIDIIGSTMTAKADYTIPALASYPVEYDANGGTGAPSKDTKYYGKTLTLKSTIPTRSGYAFQGWATSASGSVAYNPGDKYTANAKVTLYAVWKKNTFTVKYDANGGVLGSVKEQTKTYGTALELKGTATRTGYTFKGWATSASGSVAYASGANYTKDADVKLYAVWEIITYTITYKANGGSNEPEIQTKTYGKTLEITKSKPTRTGYTFQGWSLTSNGTVAYTSGADYTANSKATLYAVWKANTYTIKFDANGGTGAPGDQTKTYGVTLALSGVKPTRTGYTFKGWATSKSGSVAYASGADYKANAGVTLYAVWGRSYEKPTIKSFTVSRWSSSSATEGTVTDSGTYARVKFSWTSSSAAPSILIEWKVASASSWSSKSVTASGTSGSVTQVIGGSLSLDNSYNIRVTVNDGTVDQSSTKTLAAASFVVDVLAEGKGVALGKAAETENQFDVNFYSRFRKSISLGEKSAYTNSSAYQDGKTGVYLDSSGFIHIQRSDNNGVHPYLGFYVNDAKTASGQIRVNSSTGEMEFLNATQYKFLDHVYLPNNKYYCGLATDGTLVRMLYTNANNNCILGYGGYSLGYGTTNIYGNQVRFGVRAGGIGGTEVSFKPYFDKGDSIEVTWTGGGFVSGSTKNIYFSIPLAKPVIGTPTVTVASVNGIRVRQNEHYSHGSTSDNYAAPTSYSANLSAGNHIQITAVMSDTTYGVNNSPCGIQWSGTITFE